MLNYQGVYDVWPVCTTWMLRLAEGLRFHSSNFDAACAMCLFAWQANDVWLPSARMPAPWISLWHFLSWSWKWRGCHTQDPGVEFSRERFLTVGASEESKNHHSSCFVGAFMGHLLLEKDTSHITEWVCGLPNDCNCLILLLAILEFASHLFFIFLHHISDALKKHWSIAGIGQLKNRNFEYKSHIHIHTDLCVWDVIANHFLRVCGWSLATLARELRNFESCRQWAKAESEDAGPADAVSFCCSCHKKKYAQRIWQILT